MKLTEVHTDGYPTTLADQEFARLVKEKTNGRIVIEVHSGSELYSNEVDSINALKQGYIAFSRISCSPLSEYVDTLNVLQLPFLFRNKSHMLNVLTGEIGQNILDSIEKSGTGIIGLCFYDSGARSFYTKKPLRSIDDIRNMRIRVTDSTMMVEMIQLLGGIGIKGIGTADVYSSLKRGTIDGAENNLPTYENMGDYLIAPYYNLDAHTRIPDVLIGAEAVLKKLPPKDLEIIRECAKMTQDYEFQKWAEKEKESEKIVRESGNTVIEYTKEQLSEFEEMVQPLYEKYGQKYERIITKIKETI